MGRHGENIRKRTDGRWEARYMMYDAEKGVRVCHSVYGHTYEEVKAKRIAASKPSAIHLGINPSEQGTDMELDLPFEVIALEWLASVKAGQKPSTYEKYSFIYHSYLETSLGGVMLSRVTDKLISDSLAACKVTSESLQKSIYGVLNGILRYAAGKYHMRFHEIKRPAAAVRSKKEVRTFTRSEQTKLLSVLCTNIDLFKLGMLLCLFTGLRLGELCALKWSDIDFANKTLTVRRTVQRLYVENAGKRTALVETFPKSAHSSREIPLQDTIASLLASRQNGKEYVFGGDRPLDPRTMQNHYRAILKEAGISYKNFHTLRHTYATNCIEGGTDVKSLSEMLGHSNVKITLNYYIHPSMDTKRTYADKLCVFYEELYGQVPGRAG